MNCVRVIRGRSADVDLYVVGIRMDVVYAVNHNVKQLRRIQQKKNRAKNRPLWDAEQQMQYSR